MAFWRTITGPPGKTKSWNLLQRAGGDFGVFHLASDLVREEDLNTLYDPLRFSERFGERYNDPDGKRHFAYPPTAMVVIVPLSLFSYYPAFLAWSIAGLTLILSASLKLADDKRALAFTFTSPFLIWTLATGQMALILAGLLGIGFCLYRTGNRFRAGLVMGLLIIKPHLALALPIAFLARRDWKVIGGAAVSSGLLIMLSLLLWGLEPWRLFLENLSAAGSMNMEAGSSNLPRIPTVNAVLLNAGFSSGLAIFTHLLIAVIAVIFCIRIWLRQENHMLLFLTLLVIPPLLSPYYIDYDLAGLALAFGWIACVAYGDGNAVDRNPGLLTWSIALWLIGFLMIVADNLFGPVAVLAFLGILTVHKRQPASGK